jgi:hypothetical protein
MSDDILAQILTRLTAIEAGQTDLRGEIAKSRTELMDRMDRLQNTGTQQSRDITALLELMANNQQGAHDL